MTTHPKVTLEAQPSCVAGGPVPVKAVVTNASAEPILVNSRLLVTFGLGSGELSFEVERSDGQGYEYRAFVTPGPLQESHFVVLEPGATIEREIDLARDYGVKEPGSYRAAAHYRNAQEWTKSGLKAWTGTARSEPVAIELK